MSSPNIWSGRKTPYRYGEGAFTWITGSSGWNFMLATEWILGARRDFEGLRIDPCIPKKWKRCSIRRPFRGDVYEIEIHNPDGKERGVKQIFVDGNEINGNLIVPFKDGKGPSGEGCDGVSLRPLDCENNNKAKNSSGPVRAIRRPCSP